MNVGVGKYANKSIEWLIVKEPSYVKWILDKSDLTGPMLKVKNEISNFLAIFNKKPLIKKCFGNNCEKIATRFSVYMDNVSPFWWCDACDPYQRGAFDGKIQILRTYENALDHVKHFTGSNKSSYNQIITELAQAKGLPKRVGEKQAQDFFSE